MAMHHHMLSTSPIRYNMVIKLILIDIIKPEKKTYLRSDNQPQLLLVLVVKR